MRKFLTLITAAALGLAACSEQGNDDQAANPKRPAATTEVRNEATTAAAEQGVAERALEIGSKAREATRQKTTEVAHETQQVAGEAVESTGDMAGEVTETTGEVVEMVREKVGEAYATVKEKAGEMASEAKERLGSDKADNADAAGIPVGTLQQRQ